MKLRRLCAGCGQVVRGPCPTCQAKRNRAAAARRPDLHNDHAERRRRAQAVSDHRAVVGDWCPGWTGRPAHPSADLTADHVREVARGGHPGGRLVVRCRSCNSARSAWLASIANAALAQPKVDVHFRTANEPVSPQDGQPATPRPSKFPRQSTPGQNWPETDRNGPVVA